MILRVFDTWVEERLCPPAKKIGSSNEIVMACSITRSNVGSCLTIAIRRRKIRDPSGNHDHEGRKGKHDPGGHDIYPIRILPWPRT